MHLQVGWTTFEVDRLVYRDVWLDLLDRVRQLMASLSLRLTPMELTWRTPGRVPAGVWWTDKRFDRLRSRLDAAQLDFAGACLSIEGRSLELDDLAAVDVDASFKEPHEGADVRVSVLSTCLLPNEEDAVAEAFWTWLAPIGKQLDAVWGFVTCDPETLPLSTPYDEWYGIFLDGACRAREHPRGYYWGNLLGPTHVRRLGGTPAVTAAAEAAGLQVERVPGEGGLDCTLVRIGSPITAYTDDQLRAVKDLLDPVLIRNEPREYDPGDRPSRILLD